MKGILLTMSAIGLVVVAAGYSGSPQGSRGPSAAVQAIKANEEQWNKDYQSKNVDAVVSHYADDATLMTPGTPAAMGKDTIRVALTQMMNDPGLSLSFQARRVEVAKSGDVAFTEGSYEMTFTGPGPKPVHDKGSYVTTYRKQADGSWKAVSDIATSEVPPPGSSAEK